MEQCRAFVRVSFGGLAFVACCCSCKRAAPTADTEDRETGACLLYTSDAADE